MLSSDAQSSFHTLRGQVGEELETVSASAPESWLPTVAGKRGSIGQKEGGMRVQLSDGQIMTSGDADEDQRDGQPCTVGEGRVQSSCDESRES